MLTNSKIALSLALVLATVSAAAAAPRQAAHHQTTAQQVPGDAHLSLDSGRSTGSVHSTRSARSASLPNQPSNISAFEFERLAHLIEAIDEIGTKDYFGN